MAVAATVEDRETEREDGPDKGGRERRPVYMVRADTRIWGLKVFYGYSSNFKEDSSSVGLVNVHGYFASGSMYWRESARLASAFGFRVLNPSLPSFGGSDPMPLSLLSMESFASLVLELMDEVGLESAVVMGHSMGAAVAVEMARKAPSRVLGVVYRDGAATPSWKLRDGPVARALSPVAPDLGSLLDLALSALIDVPDIVAGKVSSTLRLVLPDVRRNVGSLTRSLPVAAMLFESDLSESLVKAATSIPMLVEWGAFDFITPPKTAFEVSELTGKEILWVPGGHSWMLARPSTQTLIFKYHPVGTAFLKDVEARLEAVKARVL